jgi:hypothetical protein
VLLEDFYRYIASNNLEGILNMDIPRSEVFYARAALKAKFPDREFTLEEVKELLCQVY